MQKKTVEPKVAILSTGLVRSLNNHNGQIHSADYDRRIEHAAEQRIAQQYKRHLETVIVPYTEATHQLLIQIALVDSHAAYISNPNARSSAKNALQSADNALSDAYLEYKRRSASEDEDEDKLGSDLIARHVHTRIEAIQKFITGRDNGEALCDVIAEMSGTYQRNLLKANMPDLKSLPGAKPGYRRWRLDLANEWQTIKNDRPDFDALQIINCLVERYGAYDKERGAYIAKKTATDNEVKIFDSLIKGKNKPARYARKLLREFEGD